ncbi:hypothetical protein ACFL6I_20405, partial [candidate division KSB1 bacterium]
FGLSEDIIYNEGRIMTNEQLFAGVQNGDIIAEASLVDRQETYPELGKADCYNDDRVHIFDRIGEWGNREGVPRVPHKPVPHEPTPGKIVVDFDPDDATSYDTKNILDYEAKPHKMMRVSRHIDHQNATERADLVTVLDNFGHDQITELDKITPHHEGQRLKLYREGVDGLDVPEAYADDQVVPVATRETLPNKLGLTHNYKMAKKPERFFHDGDGDGHYESIQDNRSKITRKIFGVDHHEIEGKSKVIPRHIELEGKVRGGHNPNSVIIESTRSNPAPAGGDLHDYGAADIGVSVAKERATGMLMATPLIGGAYAIGVSTAPAAVTTFVHNAPAPVVIGTQAGGGL